MKKSGKQIRAVANEQKKKRDSAEADLLGDQEVALTLCGEHDPNPMLLCQVRGDINKNCTKRDPNMQKVAKSRLSTAFGHRAKQIEVCRKCGSSKQAVAFNIFYLTIQRLPKGGALNIRPTAFLRSAVLILSSF